MESSEDQKKLELLLKLLAVLPGSKFYILSVLTNESIDIALEHTKKKVIDYLSKL